MRFPVAATLVIALAPALAGQEPTDTVMLTPVVVTATRLPTPADAVPAAVTVLTGEALRSQGIRTVAQALRTVPAAHVVVTDAYGSQTSLFLRGGNSDYVKVLIDGVSQNAPGGAYDFANLTTDNVERIEVVRGPVSVLYGSDRVAPTGVRTGRGRSGTTPHSTIVRPTGPATRPATTRASSIAARRSGWTSAAASLPASRAVSTPPGTARTTNTR